MNRKVLIIANSHAAAIMLAMKEKQIALDGSIEFLTLGGNELLPNLRVAQQRLYGDTQKVTEAIRSIGKGEDSLDLGMYPHIVVYGGQLLCKANGNDWISKLAQSNQFFSSAARQASYLESIHSSAHYGFLSRITDTEVLKKVISIPSPFPNILHPEFSKLKKPNIKYATQYLDLIAQEISQLGVRYLPLPVQLLAPEKYAVDSAFKVARPADVSHLNAAGGAIVLQFLLDVIQGA